MTEDLERLKWPDPVRRVKDEMDFHALAGGHGYAVFAMTDGRPLTHDTYPSRAIARRHGEKKTNDFLLILEVQPDGMTYREADAVLRYERSLNSAGYRTPDVFETEENSGMLSVPRTMGDKRRMARQLITGKPLYPAEVPVSNLPSAFRRKR